MEEFDIQHTNEKETTLNYPLIIGLIVGLLFIGVGVYWYLSKDDNAGDQEEVVTDDSLQNVDNNEATDDKVIDSTAINQDQNTDDTVAQDTQTATDTIAAGTTTDSTGSNDTVSGDTSTTADTQNVYFVVNGAFRDENNARKRLDDLKSADYNAVIVGQNDNGLFIVAYEGFPDFETAKAKLDEIRQTNPHAWIFKKRN